MSHAGALSSDPVIATVGVVVVTYHPAGEFERRLERMAAQGRLLVVVDNGSSEAVRGRLATWCTRTGSVLIANAENRGLGIALNQGVRRLAEQECEWALLFDQDSMPAADMRERMIESWQRHPARDRVCLVAANFCEPTTGRWHRFLRRHPHLPGFFQKITPVDKDLPEVSSVITSGSLVRIADSMVFGGFDEGFFIDYVDTDFCLRCLEHGRLIAVSAAAQFEHALGERRARRWCGIKMMPTNHSALRHYYIARNRISMWRRHAWRLPHWALADLATAVVWSARVVTVESGKRAKLCAIGMGTWDGLRGQHGPCPEGRRNSLLVSSRRV